jgi:hypothetical protein
MNLSTKQIAAIARTLHHLVTSDECKLHWGGIKRQEIRDAVAQGKKVSGYRVEWLRNSSMLLVDTLSGVARDFNRTYKWDHASAQDLVDILATTIAKFQSAMRDNAD